MALEQNLNLTCRIRSNSNSNFKRPYLGNETTNLISAGAKILLSSRAFTYSFMKVASRHSFTLFRPLSGRKNTFSGCSRCVPLCLFDQNMPPGPFSMFSFLANSIYSRNPISKTSINSCENREEFWHQRI